MSKRPKKDVEVKSLFDDKLVPLPSLDLWSGHDIQASVFDNNDFVVRPVFTFNQTSQILFEIPASMSQFTSPGLVLNCIVKVTAKKGGLWVPLKEDDTTMTLSSFCLSSLFSDVEIRCNNLTLTTKSSLYPFLAFFINTHVTSDDKFTKLEAEQLAYRYDPGTLSLTNGTEQKEVREAFVNNPNGRLLRGRLYLPLLSQYKTILNNSTITIVLHQTTNQFRAISRKDPNKAADSTAPEMQVEITECWLSGKRIVLFDGLYVRLMDQLKRMPSVYPFRRFTIDQSQIPLGLTTFSKTLTLATSACPDFVFLMYLKTENVNGSFGSSPFESNIGNICSAQINIESRNFPPEAYNPSDPNDLIRVFGDYKEACKNISEDHNSYNWITSKAFALDYGVIAFDLTRYGGVSSKDLENEEIYSLPRSGVTTLNLKFATGERHSKTLIIISCYRNKIFFNEAMIPSTDYAN